MYWLIHYFKGVYFMLLKRFGSFTLLLGILSSITCQSVSGTGDSSGSKSDYIYVKNDEQSNEDIEDKEVEGERLEGEEESLVSSVKNKLKKAKEFISENPVKAASAIFALAATSFAIYAGNKIKQHYFGKEGAGLEKAAEVNKELQGSETVAEIKNDVTNVPVSEDLPKDVSTDIAPSTEESEFDKSNGNNKETRNDGLDPATNKSFDPATNNIDLDPSVNVNIENKNTDKNLKSVFLGVYSDLLVYWLLKLTPQRWGWQKGWYDFWHYKNGRLAHPCKLMLGLLSWVNFFTFLFLIYTKVNKALRDGEYSDVKFDVGLGAVLAISPNLLVRIVTSLSGEKLTQRVLGGIFGPAAFWFTANSKENNKPQSEV